MARIVDIDPEFTKRILDSFHVDDLNGSLNSVNDAFEFYCKCKDRLAEGSFNLRKFISNSPELEQLVKTRYKNENEVSSDNETKVLGINWNKCADVIYFNIAQLRERFEQTSVFTKRDVLRCLASVFDPLGLILS